MRKPSLVKAQSKYFGKVLSTKVTANPDTERDIYQWLLEQPNKSGSIKKLIMADIAKKNQSS